VKRLGDTTK